MVLVCCEDVVLSILLVLCAGRKPFSGVLEMNTETRTDPAYTEPLFVWFGATFADPQIEKDYAASIRTERLRALRFFAILGGLLFWATIVADYLYLGVCAEFYQLAVLRLIAGGVSLAAALFTPFLQSDRLIDITMLIAALAVSAVICLVPYYRIEEAQIHQLITVIMVVIFYCFFPLRLSYQLFLGLFLTFFLLGVMAVAIQSKPFDITGVAIFISLANGVGFFTTRKTQRLSRMNFWKVVLLNREIAQNKKISEQLQMVHKEVERSSQQLRDAVDNISEGFVLFDKDQRLLLCNENFKKNYRFTDLEAERGTPRSALLQIGRTRNAVSTDTPQRDIEMLYARAASSYPIDIDAKLKLYDGRWLQIRERRTAAGNIVGIHSDITKMQTALEEIKTLKGILPICTNCKKIRDDSGYWEMLEAYLQRHSDVSFSHGICPVCIEELYGREEWYKMDKN